MKIIGLGPHKYHEYQWKNLFTAGVRGHRTGPPLARASPGAPARIPRSGKRLCALHAWILEPRPSARLPQFPNEPTISWAARVSQAAGGGCELYALGLWSPAPRSPSSISKRAHDQLGSEGVPGSGRRLCALCAWIVEPRPSARLPQSPNEPTIIWAARVSQAAGGSCALYALGLWSPPLRSPSSISKRAHDQLGSEGVPGSGRRLCALYAWIVEPRPSARRPQSPNEPTISWAARVYLAAGGGCALYALGLWSPVPPLAFLNL
ncbi:hypothetical protein NDU88_003254 [Pleurodeles waltl]|uniref:Uncharacterized protein n=1 Tax=Pleurodeles waltl TaxID=8319 RepID=A0AAV7WRX6_PLEWA|nr:hypothetical protein NDU88_003254 [Pleurodeles waltl]